MSADSRIQKTEQQSFRDEEDEEDEAIFIIIRDEAIFTIIRDEDSDHRGNS